MKLEDFIKKEIEYADGLIKIKHNTNYNKGYKNAMRKVRIANDKGTFKL